MSTPAPAPLPDNSPAWLRGLNGVLIGSGGAGAYALASSFGASPKIAVVSGLGYTMLLAPTAKWARARQTANPQNATSVGSLFLSVLGSLG